MILTLAVATSTQSQQILSIRFDNRFGNHTLTPEQTYYLGDDTLVINRFKYYVSHIELVKEDGNVYRPPNEYYLIDIATESSCSIQMPVPSGKFTGIRFLLGVDSLRNVSGVQTGALDPLHGMFWTWNSGYIMAKLEGTSTRSRIAGKQFTYHVGGFRKQNNTARLIELSGTSFQDSMTVIADASLWLTGPYPIDIAQQPICHSPGELAVRIANNYSRMFSLSGNKE